MSKRRRRVPRSRRVTPKKRHRKTKRSRGRKNPRSYRKRSYRKIGGSPPKGSPLPPVPVPLPQGPPKGSPLPPVPVPLPQGSPQGPPQGPPQPPPPLPPQPPPPVVPRIPRLVEILRSGKVYELQTLVNLDITFNGRNIRFVYDDISLGHTEIEVMGDAIIAQGGTSRVYSLKVDDRKIPVVLKQMDREDMGEEFFSKVFRHVPEFQTETVVNSTTDSRTNCGIVQSYYLTQGRYHYMLLESGAGDSSTSKDLHKWITDNEGEDDYMVKANSILAQTTSQLLCLQSYGVYFFDIKTANILIIENSENGHLPVRALFIDVGGMIYHIPTLKAAIEALEPEVVSQIKAEIITGDIPRGVGYYLTRYHRFLNMKNLTFCGFPSSYCPLFMDGGESGVVNPRDITEANLFHILAISLIANEIICKGKGKGSSDDPTRHGIGIVGGVLTRLSDAKNFRGLGWRGYNIQWSVPRFGPTPAELTVLQEKLLALEGHDCEEMFTTLITDFITHWPGFREPDPNSEARINIAEHYNPESDRYLVKLLANKLSMA